MAIGEADQPERTGSGPIVPVHMLVHFVLRPGERELLFHEIGLASARQRDRERMRRG